MPELPEVETVARQLRPLIVGRRIRRTKVFDKKLEINDKSIQESVWITEVDRLGKQIVISLSKTRKSTPSRYLAVHLRMTGRLLWETSDCNRSSQPRCCFECDTGNLSFYDTRRFGTISCVSDPALLEPRGTDPYSSSFTVANLLSLIGSSKQPVKPWLLRQDKIVGLGNIYASEILFASRIHPARPVGSLSRKEVTTLRRTTLSILDKAIENCGTTFSDFQDTSGSIGNYGEYLRVYGREGERCKRCRKSEISKIFQAGRSTYFCPACQASLV